MIDRLACLFFGVFVVTPAFAQSTPLPSWHDGPTRDNIINFVERVTTPGHPDFVPENERIATFDNDGTLWCEFPVVQLAFVSASLQQMLPNHPEWKEDAAVQAVLDNNLDYFLKNGEQELARMLALTHSGMTREEFRERVGEFFRAAKHPKYNVAVTQTAYQPMLELLNYLRSKGFQTWICTGGGAEFVRVISENTYGIPAQQVIGSIGGWKFENRDGKSVLVKTPELLLKNDKEDKPVGIAIQTGGTPIFACGNVRSGGDIAMLEMARNNSRPNFQLLIHHDDEEREIAYGEKDNASLEAAKEQGWQVVSMKNDWKTIFPFQKEASNDR